MSITGENVLFGLGGLGLGIGGTLLVQWAKGKSDQKAQEESLRQELEILGPFVANAMSELDDKITRHEGIADRIETALAGAEDLIQRSTESKVQLETAMNRVDDKIDELKSFNGSLTTLQGKMDQVIEKMGNRRGGQGQQ